MIRKVYGEMILKKDSILYHTSNEPFTINKEKPMLFCLFHPSEWGKDDQYITPIVLKKDISLAFLIENIKNLRIFSAVDTFISYEDRKLTKRYITRELEHYIKYLKNENYDGWFASIQNHGTVEVALINDENVFTVLETVPLKRYWRNGYIKDHVINIKEWRDKYIVCTVNCPAILNINDRFRILIKKYLRAELKSGFINEYVFQVILKNAEIYYHNWQYEIIDWHPMSI